MARDYVLIFNGVTGTVKVNRMSSYPTALQNETLIQRAETEAANAHVRIERIDNQLVELVLAGDQFAFEQINSKRIK